MNPCVAHRGWSGRAPENTMAAFQLAMSEPAVNWIELDVQLSKDGIPVVIHDFTLKRTTNGNGNVKDHTYEELSRLDAGAWFDKKFAGEAIPSLEQVLRAVRGRCRLNIELKTARSMYPEIERRVVQLVRKYHMQHDVMVTSFDHEAVKRVRNEDPDFRTGLIISGMPVLIRDQLEHAGASVLSINYHYLTADFAHRMISGGYQVMAWTVNDSDMISAVAAMHPEIMICTNHPDRVLQLFG
jgi:glycerophosphoryl diester phosphodiesterase